MIVQLRISDLKHERIYFVQAGGGSILREANVDWEDDEYWAFPFYISNDNAYTYVENYVLVSKATGEKRDITKDELKAIKKKSKEKNK